MYQNDSKYIKKLTLKKKYKKIIIYTVFPSTLKRNTRRKAVFSSNIFTPPPFFSPNTMQGLVGQKH
jgi:hypothetical protein